MNLADALTIDRDGKIQAAAAAYEDVLESNPANLVAILNLAALYWQMTDYGLSAAEGLRPEVVANAGRRLQELLKSAKQHFPDNPEVFFWTKYIAWADLGESFDATECRDLLRTHPNYLEPAMVLFSRSDGTEAATEAMELLRRCSADQTTRCRYIVSVIEGVLKRR